MKRWVVLMGAVLVAFAGAAQQEGFGARHYPEKLRADAELLRAAIHQAHPDPYRYVTRGELDAAFDALIDSIREPLTSDRFMARLMPVLARIGDSSIRLWLDASIEERILRSAPLLPLEVCVLEDGLFIAGELKGFRTFPPGSRILSVNGLHSERIVRELGAWVAVDGANETWRRHQVQERFAWLFLLTYGQASSYRIEYVAPDGVRHEEVVSGLLQEDIDRSRKPKGVTMHPWRSTWEPESGTLWASFTTLDPEALRRSGQKPRAFLEGLVKEAQSNGARAVVLDLRGADGRELAAAELIFSHFAREPFRLIQGITVRATQPQVLPGFTMPDDFLVSLDRSYLPPQNGTASLRPDDPRLALVAPSMKAYHGRLYVVTDGGTRDAAAALAMVACRTGRARLVGEEPASNAHSFTGGRSVEVKARHSLLHMELPLLRYLPDGASDAPVDRGEQPRLKAQPQPADLARGRDGVRTALLSVIREVR